VLVGCAAWGYQRYGAVPQVAAVLYGLKPVVIAAVLQALWSLGRTAITNAWPATLALGAVLAAAVGVPELAVLLLAALAGGALHALRTRPASAAAVAPWLLLSTAVPTVSAGSLFVVFLKIGAVLFGSGYVLLAFLRAELVERLGWITEQQLLDAVAVGQVTPGPLFTTATFIGYLLDGVPGAAAATLAIFLPAFVFVAVSGWLLPRIRRSRLATAMLEGVTVGSLALMAVVTAQLAQAALIDAVTVGLAAVALAVLLRYRVSPGWLVLLGAAVGLVAYPG
jgi:chromate transporter